MHPFLIAALLATAPATGAAGRPAASSVPTMAVEDTMRTEVPEVLVRAPRVTLDEILSRVARGEARRESRMTDQTFTITIRVVGRVEDPKKPPKLLVENVVRVYKKRPGKVRSVLLRNYRPKPDKKGDDPDIQIRTGMDEEIVNFAFRPEARRDFQYHIAGRDVLGNHLIYRIAFEPRSVLDPTIPSGLVWVDTNEFVIVRQEVRFDRSPIPLFLKEINRMVIERQRVEDHWVLKRVLLRAETSIPFPQIGRTFDFGIFYDDYAVNTGLPDSLFAAGGSTR